MQQRFYFAAMQSRPLYVFLFGQTLSSLGASLVTDFDFPIFFCPRPEW